ncbi:MAG: tetratricopeptide repeat protein [Deltaproteobacteria bacterium]|nr:MAG: tetratricopeptide repeat protein [Deltaproteobacteria bacterium]
MLKQAIRLDPFPTVMAYHNLAMSYVFAGMPNEALETFRKALKVEPNNLPANLGLAVAYASLGREEDARTVGAKILEINPKFSVKAFAKKLPYKNQAYRALLIDGLIKAGLPETPPLPLPDKPSIAVLPFTNMSDDPKQE